MMDYTLCDQTVTVYSKSGRRQVLEGTYFALEEGVGQETGAPERRFLLIVPGSRIRVFVGDRVLPGIGPMEVDWETFLPVHVPGLVEVGCTRHYRLDGEVTHMEAGHLWN